MSDWRSCEESTSAKHFIAGAVAQGATWTTAGFFFGEALGFGAGGGPGAVAGLFMGEGINAASFALDYASCKLTDKVFLHSMSDFVFGAKGAAEAALPELKIEQR